MPGLSRTAVLRYLSATGAVLLATAARLALDPVLGDLYPFITLFPAVMVVAAYAGRGPALVATGLGAIASAQFLLRPRGSLVILSLEDRVGLGLYLVVGMAFAALGGALRDARRKAEADAEIAARQREEALRDVSHRKAIESELRREEEMLRCFLEHAPVGVAMFDREMRYLLVSRRWSADFGLVDVDVRGRSHYDIFPEIPDCWREAHRRCLDGAIERADEDSFIRPDGREEWLRRLIRPWRDDRGDVGGIIIFSEIITDRKAIELENARLCAELKDADQSKNQFLATLAHELRNPLAPIRNVLHLMRDSATAGAVLEADRDMAERHVVHLTRLIDDLMDVARISRGKIELHKQVVDLATVVNHAVQTSRHLLLERRHLLTLTLPEEVIRLEADPTRLEQVLWNLLNNAAKYTEPGGRIALSVEREDGDVVVRVRDSGMGIKPEMLPRIFDMFVQAGDHVDHAHGGLGIGLCLVRTLVELHSGSITAQSAGPGRGSEFVVRLPVLPPARVPRAPEEDPDGQPDGKPPCCRILVVDDNVDAAKSLGMLLSLYGQEVRVANDGPEALIVAAEFRPDVVLLDIGMPRMDGNQVVRHLRERPEFEKTLMVALTGWSHESDVDRSRSAGFDHHLVKPADPGAILDLLTKARNKI